MAQYFIDKHDAQFSDYNNQNNTILHFLATCTVKRKDAVRFIKHNATKFALDKINQQNNFGETPPFIACQAGNLDLVRYFLKQGADPFLLDNEKNTLLHAAASSGNAALVNFLIAEDLANLNQMNAARVFPLHVAVAYGSKDVVTSLLAQNADCNPKGSQTPLALACSKKDFDLIPELLKKTTLSRDDLNFKTTVLSIIQECDREVKEIFLEKALDDYIADRKSQAPYLDPLSLGIPQEEKIAAAEEFKKKINGHPCNLKIYDKALNTGVLGNLYIFYDYNNLFSHRQLKTSYALMQQAGLVKQKDHLEEPKSKRSLKEKVSVEHEEESPELVDNTTPTPFTML